MRSLRMSMSGCVVSDDSKRRGQKRPLRPTSRACRHFRAATPTADGRCRRNRGQQAGSRRSQPRRPDSARRCEATSLQARVPREEGGSRTDKVGSRSWTRTDADMASTRLSAHRSMRGFTRSPSGVLGRQRRGADSSEPRGFARPSPTRGDTWSTAVMIVREEVPDSC